MRRARAHAPHASARERTHRFSPFFLPNSPASSYCASSPSSGGGAHSVQPAPWLPSMQRSAACCGAGGVIAHSSEAGAVLVRARWGCHQGDAGGTQRLLLGTSAGASTGGCARHASGAHVPGGGAVVARAAGREGVLARGGRLRTVSEHVLVVKGERQRRRAAARARRARQRAQEVAEVAVRGVEERGVVAACESAAPERAQRKRAALRAHVHRGGLLPRHVRAASARLCARPLRVGSKQGRMGAVVELGRVPPADSRTQTGTRPAGCQPAPRS